jgi:hypothetical protein
MKFLLLLIILPLLTPSYILSQFPGRISNYESSTILLTQLIPYKKSFKGYELRKTAIYGTGIFAYDDLCGTNSHYFITNMHFVVHDSLKLFLSRIQAVVKETKAGNSVNDKYAVSYRQLPLLRSKTTPHRYYKHSQYLVPSDKEILWRSDTSSFSDLIVVKIDSAIFFSNESSHYSKHRPIKLSEIMEYKNTDVGDEIFTFGYPEIAGTFNEIKSKSRNIRDFATDYIAVLRAGHISAKPKETICTFQKQTILARNVFINELFIYPGQSGSPVFLKRNGKIYLVGIVSAYFKYKDEANNTGLSLAWPADIITKIIKDNKKYFTDLKFEDQ